MATLLRLIFKMETRQVDRRRYNGTRMWQTWVILGYIFVGKSFLWARGDTIEDMLETTTTTTTKANETPHPNKAMRFQDWSKVIAREHNSKQNLTERSQNKYNHAEVATTLLRKEKEHDSARQDLQRWLTPSQKWHFVLGYKDVRALKVARTLNKEAQELHHFPTRNNNALHYLLAFTSVASAETFRKNRLFHAVEPLLPYLKIEDLTLGALIRQHEDPKQRDPPGGVSFPDEMLSLKATLAHGALASREVKLLARRWQVALQQQILEDGLFFDEHYSATFGYMDTGGHSHEADSPPQNVPSNSTAPGLGAVECRGDMAAIVCSHLSKHSLKGVANFMAFHAVVQLVELNPRYEVFNKWAKYVTQSVSGKHLPVFNKGLHGEGEVIACADTGVDMDHCFFRDESRPVPMNVVDLQARKVVQYVISRGDKPDYEEGHGTHVAGSIAGNTQGDDINDFAGMAPAAKIAFFDLGSNASNLKAPIGLVKGMFSYGYMAGARVFSNSWGTLRQGYSSNSHEVDSFSYLNENVLILFAVGNQGSLGKGTVASPASSKNCLAVGASFNAAPSLASQRLDYSRFLEKPSSVAPFSSIGPTLDGRIKPDVLAPGMVVWSSVPNIAHGPFQKNCQIGPKQGTSSSTPLVAGLASLARQYFREGYYPSGTKNTNDSFIPSGALLKAVMIHSAVPEHIHVNISSFDNLQYAPDSVQGYGLVVLEKVLVFATPRSKQQPSQLYVLSGRRDGAVIKHKKNQSFTLTVTSSKEPLRITMVWMDPPAAPSSLHPMVNDLNLKATSPNNKTLYPNGMNEEDFINNVEVIHVMKPKKGGWKVTVEAKRVINDGQPYALLVTGSFTLGTRSGYKEGTNFRNNHYPSDDVIVKSNANLQGTTLWESSSCFCIFLGTLFLAIIVDCLNF